ncbi:ABC transporter permease [Sporanaerobium hydrogeniformans]|uniref:ABC transporter permease n=1 Tax=Sporanaerobium hydrogeniformans TaxID=3072179 RepID=A0AC61DCX0_9FIRM|nr:carbohydrate ABC transporter permease [Sporanaerobium hydrogeniformans]PHV70446.1 ABC transporter permease [Sporanaerobium hydrogeniformans]
MEEIVRQQKIKIAHKRKIQSKTLPFIGKLGIALILLIEIYPIIWIILSSFKSTQEFNMTPSYSLPTAIHLENYVTAWKAGKMNIFFTNSAINTLVSLIFILAFSTMASFALTKMKWKGRDLVLKIFLSGIMIPTVIVLIPLFTVYKNVGLLNTRTALIISYVAFGLSLSIYLLSTYLKYIPDDLIEAAVIDGANIYQVFLEIILPLLKTGIVTVLVIQFFFKWNDLMFSMTFVSKTELKTIQTGLLYFSDMYGNRNWGAIFASIGISVMPTLLLYGCLNKMVIEGMTSGAVKG